MCAHRQEKRGVCRIITVIESQGQAFHECMQREAEDDRHDWNMTPGAMNVRMPMLHAMRSPLYQQLKKEAHQEINTGPLRQIGKGFGKEVKDR